MTEEIYFSHSQNDRGEWHSLKDHLEATATIMQEFSNNSEYVLLFWRAGLLHDLGKYQNEFQQYLIKGGKRGSVPHAVWGAAMARVLKQPELAFVIDGHHKGMPNKAELQLGTETYQNVSHHLQTEIFPRLLQDFGITESYFDPIRTGLDPFDREFFIRFLFSALTDADWLDTERHFNQHKANARKSKCLDCDILIRDLEEKLSKKSKKGFINELRNSVKNFALSRAYLPVGFFSMNLPTGLGKTLASVSWALNHAKHNNLKRIIIVLPFVNIIDQTAEELKSIFGEDWVLEHHSSYNDEESSSEQMDKSTNLRKLATENWDFPIIVTTTVQFFDSLFSNKPKRCRRIHNISESVVIFDEVQSLPKELISPTISILGSINRVMRTSVLFCTATQPAFQKTNDFTEGLNSITSLVESPEVIYSQTKRVEYKILNSYIPIGLAALIPIMKDKEKSILSIYNTKKCTLDAFNLVKGQETYASIYHLSTGMCADHRKKVIQNIKNDLRDRKRIFVVSTQLIEAGVDLDFPCVFREAAPLESIIQAAGRCNREGKMNELGEVFIFQLEESGFPDELYRTLTKHTLSLIKPDLSQLYSYNFFTQYYASAVKLFVDTDKKKINDARKSLDFETVSEAYHLIENETTGLFIANYSPETLGFLETLKFKPFLSKEDFRFMQTYTVQVYENFLRKTHGQWVKKEEGYHIWYGSYDKDTGITADSILTDSII